MIAIDTNLLIYAQIALCALDGGATELWTHDRRFVKVPGLRLRDPLTRA